MATTKTAPKTKPKTTAKPAETKTLTYSFGTTIGFIFSFIWNFIIRIINWIGHVIRSFAWIIIGFMVASALLMVSFAASLALIAQAFNLSDSPQYQTLRESIVQEMLIEWNDDRQQ